MFFRNAAMFRIPTGFDFSQLEELLADHPLKPVGPMEMSSRGFIPPHGRDSEVLAAPVGDAYWLAIGSEDKVLPAAVVNEALAKKLAEMEKNEGRKPGGRARKRIKEDLIHEMLPNAFVKPGRIDLIIDVVDGVVYVDTSSRRSAEAAISEVRLALGSFPALPLNAEIAPRNVLTSWIAGEPMPAGLSLGEECELKDAMDGGAVVKCQHQELQSDEITRHLESGKQVTRLALSLNDCVSFVLGEDLIIRKLKFLDGALDLLENTEREDLKAELDARMFLTTAELRRVFEVLSPSLNICAAEAVGGAVKFSAASTGDGVESLRNDHIEGVAQRASERAEEPA